MRLKRITATTLSIAASAVLLSGTTQASAAEETGEIVTTVPRIVNADHPKTKIGTKLSAKELAKARSLSSTVPTTPTLTEEGQTTAQRTGATYEVDADRIDSSIGLKSPRAYDPIQDCSNALAGGTGDKVVNHFMFCSVRTAEYDTVSLPDRTVIGTTSWLQITAGTSGAEERVAHFTTSLDSFKREGTTATPGLLEVGFSAGGYNGSDGSNKACDVLGSDANPVSEKVWETTAKRSVHTIDSSKADGYGRDFISRCGFSSFFRNPAGWSTAIATDGLRQDSAEYFWETPTNRMESISVFDRTIPVMQYSRTSPSHGAVAKHIYLAQTNPNATDPVASGGKLIPGSPTSGLQLHRLYDKWDAVATTAKKENTAAKDKACGPIRPSDPTGLDCDEYPFASTWEGARSGINYFSVKYLDSTQNRSAGSQLGDWYTKDRILHKDGFYVQIS